MIDTLITKQVINIKQEKIGTSQSPLFVISDDFKFYYLKTPSNNTPELSIIKEFLCHFLLNCWELKTPPIAALKVDPNFIGINLSPHHKSEYFKRTCFGSENLESSSDFISLLSLSSKYDYNKFSAPLDLLKIGLFDIWIENDDRKPTNPNLLVQETGTGFDLYAIDHALTFSSMKFTDLNPALDLGVSYNDSLLNTDLAKSIAKYAFKGSSNWFEQINSYFYNVVNNSNVFFNKILESIPEDLGLTDDCYSSLFNFLFSESRNKRVFDEFLGRFKL